MNRNNQAIPKEYLHRFIASDGAELEYLDMGNGKPLMYLHGYGGSAAEQYPLFLLLKDSFRCVTFSQRGYGSSQPKAPMNLEQSAKDAKELIEFLKLEDVALVGYSMGSAVLFSYVSQFGCIHLEKVLIGDMSPKVINEDGWNMGLYQGWYTRAQYEKDLDSAAKGDMSYNKYFIIQCILPNTPSKPRNFKFKLIWNLVLSKAAKVSGKTVQELVGGDERLMPTNMAYLKSMMECDFRDDLQKITVPAMLAYASPGSLYDPRAAEYLYDHIPKADRYEFDNSTHLTPVTEKVGEFASLIRDFFLQ